MDCLKMYFLLDGCAKHREFPSLSLPEVHLRFLRPEGTRLAGAKILWRTSVFKRFCSVYQVHFVLSFCFKVRYLWWSGPGFHGCFLFGSWTRSWSTSWIAWRFQPSLLVYVKEGYQTTGQLKSNGRSGNNYPRWRMEKVRMFYEPLSRQDASLIPLHVIKQSVSGLNKIE